MNTGFDSRKNVWKKATGKAYFVEGPDVGRLKVSLFAPF
jgi:apolipoprotein D and lipocalin family protein